MYLKESRNITVLFVDVNLQIDLHEMIIRESTQGNGLAFAISVERLSKLNHLFSHTASFTLMFSLILVHTAVDTSR
jgi:hypothetical protein